MGLTKNMDVLYAKCIPVILTCSVELIRLELYRYLRFTACVVEVLLSSGDGTSRAGTIS